VSKSKAVPKYKSCRYYSILFNGKQYKGWVSQKVGNGKMTFSHPSLGYFSASKPTSNDWIKACWEDFIEFTQRFENTATTAQG